MAKVRLPGNGAPKRPPTFATEPQWRVKLYLGDQCDWYIGGKVIAKTEVRAIAIARNHVVFAWPDLQRLIECAPATATQAH